MFERCCLKHHRKMDTSGRLFTVIFIFVVMLVPLYETGALPEPVTKCPKVYAPVCASNNKTYSNGCELERENCKRSCDNQLFIINLGKCGTIVTDPDFTIYGCERVNACTLILAPVCGSDGVTYGNSCILFRSNCRRCPKCVVPQKCTGNCPCPSKY